MLKKFAKSEKGFTLIELLIVVAIIGILAAIAIPQFSAYRQRGYNANAQSDIRNAFSAAQLIFAENPTAEVTTVTLTDNGYRASTGVTLTVNDGNLLTLDMEAQHDEGSNIYTVDNTGAITFAAIPAP